MRMFELIMGKNDCDEANELEKFSISNVICSNKSLTEPNSSFRARLVEAIKSKDREEGPVKVTISPRRIQLANSLNRSLIRRQLDVQDCEKYLALYKQALIIDQYLKQGKAYSGMPIENIINTALLSSEKELLRGI